MAAAEVARVEAVRYRAADPGRVGSRDHREHAGQRARRIGVDGDDPGVGVGASHDGAMRHAGEREVGGVAGSAADDHVPLALAGAGTDRPSAGDRVLAAHGVED